MTERTDVPASLRIRELVIENYRCFSGRVVIPFANQEGVADSIAVFHGANGTGKSTAIAALELFFDWAAFLLSDEAKGGSKRAHWGERFTPSGGTPRAIGSRDRSPGIPVETRTRIEVRFGSGSPGIAVTFTPFGRSVEVTITLVNDTGADSPLLQDAAWATRLDAPRGPVSRPIAVLDAQRHAHWTARTPQDEVFPKALAAELYRLRRSHDPTEKERARVFVDALRRFPSFADLEIHMEADSELQFERRKRFVLLVDELSSGEQHVAALVASMLLSRASILCVSEPEQSLDDENKALFRTICEEQVEAGVFDQILIESHDIAFDGPEVVRFSRDQVGNCTARREQAAKSIDEEARRNGAQTAWISPGGYMKLPETVVKETGTSVKLYFVRTEKHWEAWSADEMSGYLRAAADTEE